MRIGFTAAFRTEVTVHARGFLQGIYLGAQLYPDVRRAEWYFYDDNASIAGGLEAAEYFIRKKVDVVIGHFASESAAAALPLYEAHEIPLLLPASTCATLTARSASAFRLCASDKALAMRLMENLTSRPVGKYALFSDDSLHGCQQAAEIEKITGSLSLERVDSTDAADVLIYCGRLKTSAQFLREVRASKISSPVYFTDDAYSESLFTDISAPGEVIIFSFPTEGDKNSARYKIIQRLCLKYFRHEPLLYTGETLSALSLLNAEKQNKKSLMQRLKSVEFITPVGKVLFEKGENKHSKIQVIHYSPEKPLQKSIV